MHPDTRIPAFLRPQAPAQPSAHRTGDLASRAQGASPDPTGAPAGARAPSPRRPGLFGRILDRLAQALCPPGPRRETLAEWTSRQTATLPQVSVIAAIDGPHGFRTTRITMHPMTPICDLTADLRSTLTHQSRLDPTETIVSASISRASKDTE